MSICIRLTIEQHVVHLKIVNEIDNKKKGLQEAKENW